MSQENSYQQLDFLESFPLNTLVGVRYRYADNDRCAVENMQAILSRYKINLESSLVVLDTGHAHSVAMAAHLAENAKIIFKNKDTSWETDNIAITQYLSAIRYFIPILTEYKAKPKAFDAYVLDIHRNTLFDATEFPSTNEIQTKNIKNIYVFLEGNNLIREFNPYKDRSYDLNTLFQSYQSAGISVNSVYINPYSCDYIEYKQTYQY